MRLDPQVEATIRSILPGDAWRLTRLVDSHNLVVRARGAAVDVVVRVQPTKRMNSATAQALVAFLLALSNDAALRVPRPLRLASGEWFATGDRHGEEHRYSLVSWVPGEPAVDAKAFARPQRLRAVGAAVAHMHAKAVGMPPDVDEALPALDANALFGETCCVHHPALRDEVGPLRHRRLTASCDVMADALRSRESHPNEVGCIHADLEPQNWVFDDERPGVIDFDEVRRGPFALDLLSVLWTHAMWKDYPSLRTHLLDGYEEVRPLPAGTRDEADVLMATAFVTWLDFVYRELTDEAREPHRQYVRPMVEHIVSWCRR